MSSSIKEKTYIHPGVFVRIIESNLHNELRNIKDLVNNAHISATEEKIKKFLAEKYEEDSYDLKLKIARLQGRKKTIGNDLDLLIEKLDIDESKYEFDPFSLKYYQMYSNVLKLRSIKLLMIIEHIIKKDLIPIKQEIESLDLDIDDDGNILKSDVLRLSIPLLCNIKLLLKMVREASNPESYLKDNFSKIRQCIQGDIEINELFPQEELQLPRLSSVENPLYVPFTDKQSEELLQKELIPIDDSYRSPILGNPNNSVIKLVNVQKTTNVS